MSNGLYKCREAFERLKEGEPNNKRFLGLRLTPSIVSQEAGFDAGYLKRNRPNHAALISEIDKESQKRGQSSSTSAKQKVLKAQRSKENAESNAERYKQALDAALAREIRLIKRVRELEAELENIKN